MGLDRLVKIEDEIFDESRAEVLAQTTMLGGTGTSLTHFNLYKIDGRWKIGLSIAAERDLQKRIPEVVTSSIAKPQNNWPRNEQKSES
jgi:hypothetical protein